ncbi:uncharacterized protein LOC132251137 [Alligator mississippiensis]|uniref:uncharacterized protein LOC132251137 n=1 Tax=Alligator mississippiensis TaxID=8496 RepID=UPI0028778DEA|nr:uncharacterized protein LOC132251137 [Alligator mississippiensis]
MGLGSSREENSATPLGFMLRNFSKFKGDYGVKMSKDRLITFCQEEWPSFGVGWPDVGSFDVKLANEVLSVITKDGHWDQYPYVDCWVSAVMNPSPPWVQKCKGKMCKMLLAKDAGRKPRVLSDSGSEVDLTQGLRRRDEARPPPDPRRRVEPRTQPGINQMDQEEIASTSYSKTGTDQMDQEKTAGTSRSKTPPPYEGKNVTEPNSLSPTAPDPPQTHWSALQSDQPPLQEPRSTRNQNPNYQCPLREIMTGGGDTAFVYVPFNTSDLFSWKNQNPSFKEDPEKMQNLFRLVGQTYRPTWADIQMMLHTLLTSEKRRLVQGTANRIAEERLSAGEGGNMRDICPIESPDWDNSAVGRQRNNTYSGIIVEALGEAVPWVTNLSKLYEVRQGKDESPSVFLERLFDAFKKFSDLSPEAIENQRMVNLMFIGQAAPDIKKKKLQKTEGAAGKPLSELVEIAYKVYGNRDQVAERREEKHGQKQMTMLAAALGKSTNIGGRWKEKPAGGQKKGTGRFKPDECAYCREKGHWRRDCPKMKVKQKKSQWGGRQMRADSSGEDSS